MPEVVAHRPSQRKHDEDQHGDQPMQRLRSRGVVLVLHEGFYHLPVFGIEAQGSAGGKAPPF